MALFKVSKGAAIALGGQALVDGYCWFTYDDGKFYIDYADPDDNNTVKRRALNAEKADKDSLGNTINTTYAVDIDFTDGTLTLKNKAGDPIGTASISIPTASDTSPNMDGTAAAGTATTWSRSDHVHPTDTSRAPTNHASSSTTYGKGDSSNYGHLKLSSSTSSTSGVSGGIAATPAAVKAAYELAAGKQDPLTFDGTYNSSTNKAATESTVTDAINDLDVSNITGFGAGKTLASLSETDGKIAATFQDIEITKTQVSDFPTNVSAFTNDAEYLTAHQTYTQFTGKPTGNQTPGFGDTFTIQQISQNTSGQVSGTDKTVTIPSTVATTSAAGLMSKEDKAKLDGIADNANNYTYTLPTASSSTKGGVKVNGGGLTMDNETIKHSNSSITAKASYGSTATTASANGGKITVTDITYDAYGHITGSTDREITLSQTTYTVGNKALKIAGDSGTATQAITMNESSGDKIFTISGDTYIGTTVGGSSGAATLTIAHSTPSGLTTGSYGNSSNQTPGYGSTFNVPYITVDAGGHITAISNKTVKIPASDNTDTLVAQTAMTSSENAAYKLLTTSSASPTSGSAAEAKYSTNLTYNPNTDTLSAGHLTLSGNAYLNNKTYADDITTGSLLVNGSANFVQSPLAPTPTPGDSTQKLATTEFVHNAVSGLSGAMHFRGTTTSGVVDGSTTNPITINGNSYTATAGDVVLREITTGNIFEYVWTGSAWEMLGRDTSFKVQQDLIPDNTGTTEITTANQFIYSFSQNANGEVSVKTRPLATASDSTLGGIKTNYSASGKYYAIKVDNSGNAYVNVPWADTTYTFNTTAQTNKIQYKATGASSWTDVPITISIINNITGSGSSGSLAKFNGNNTITSGPALANSISSQTQTTKFLREDGTWAAPSYTTNTTYTFASGDGSFTVTPSGGSEQTVSIGTVPIAQGGTGATTALAAITNLGGPSIASAGNKLTSNDNIDTLTSYGTYYVPSTSPSPEDGRPDGTEPHTAGYKLYYIKGYNSDKYDIQLAFSSGEIARMRMRSGSNNTWNNWLNLVRSTAGSAVGSATNPVYVTSTGMITACDPTNELRVYDGDTSSANIGSTPIYIKTNIVLSTSESRTIIGTIRTGGYTYDGSSNIIPFNIYWNKTQLAFSNGSYTDLLGTSLSGITALAINETVDGITTTYLYLQIARSKTYITYAVNCQLGTQPQVNCAVRFTTENSVLGENNINVIASLALTRYATVTTSELTVNSLTASQAVSTNANKKLVSTDLTVSDPAASGTGITYIATISQSAVGKITATKSTVRSASTEQTGVLQFTAANTNTQLATLPNWTANPTDDTYLIRKDNGGTDVFGQVKFSTVWNYIKGKITSDVPNLYWANQDISSSASYNTQPEVATIKLNGNTSAAAASTNNVQLVYDSTLAVLNFVFS